MSYGGGQGYNRQGGNNNSYGYQGNQSSGGSGGYQGNQTRGYQGQNSRGGGGYQSQQPSYNRGSNYSNSQQQSGGYRQQAAAPAPQQTSNRRQTVGTVTKIHDKFCFIDNDIFCQLSLFRSAPRIGDRYHVEAEYNPQMPFKWNAIRVAPYVQPKQSAAPVRTSSGDNRRGDTRPSNRGSDSRDSRAGNDRKRESNRDSRSTSSRDTTRRSQEPRRDEKRDSSSHTKAANLLQFPCGANPILDVAETQRRYRSKIYTPSHFVAADNKGWEAFENTKIVNHIVPETPLSVVPIRNEDEFNAFADQVEPEDLDPKYQARILMIAGPGQEKLMELCAKSDIKSRTKIARTNKNLLRCVGAIVDYRNNQYYLPGGSWSPSLDGEDIDDGQTLINTAIRSAKKGLGIDLSGVKNWYRFLECHYKRSADADSELVAGHTAIFVPSMVDIMPTDEEWEATKVKYTAAMEAALAKPEEDQIIAQQESDEKFHKEQAEKKAAKEHAKAQRMAEKEKLAEERRKKAAELEAKKEESEQKVVDGEDKAEKEAEKEADNEDAPAAEDKPEEEQMVESSSTEELLELDVAKLKVAELKEHLEKLELDTKGKKAELVERLQAHIDEVKNNSQADEAKVEEDSKDAEEVAETAEEPEKVDEPEKSEKSDAGEGIEVNADEENEKMEDDKVEEEVPEEVESDEDSEVEELPPKIAVKELTAREKSDIKRKYEMPKDKCILAHYTLARQIRIVNLQSLLNVSVRKTDCADEAARERIFETQIVVELLVEMLQRDFSKEIWFGLMKYSKIVADRKAKKEKEEAEKKLKDEAEKKIKEEEAAKKKAEDEEIAAKKAEEDAAKLAEEAAKKEADAEMKTEEENAENAETAETEEKTENAKTADAEDKMDESAEVKAEESAEVKTEEKTGEEAKMDESADPVAEVKSEDKSEDAEEPAAKKSKTEEETEVKETEVKETEEEKKAKVEAAKLAAEEERKIKEREYPKYKYDHGLLMACGFFDDAYQGAIRRTDLVEILQFGGLGISNMQLTNLLRKCALGHDSISYSKMFSDIPIDFEWERPEGVVLSRNSHRNSAGVAELDSEGLRAQVDASRLATDNARGASAAYKEELERVRSKLERTESDKERQHERARTNIEKLRETVKELDSVKVEAAKVGGLLEKIKELEDKLNPPVVEEPVVESEASETAAPAETDDKMEEESEAKTEAVEEEAEVEESTE